MIRRRGSSGEGEGEREGGLDGRVRVRCLRRVARKSKVDEHGAVLDGDEHVARLAKRSEGGCVGRGAKTEVMESGRDAWNRAMRMRNRRHANACKAEDSASGIDIPRQGEQNASDISRMQTSGKASRIRALKAPLGHSQERV
eukprot:5097433-Pleurochrysis_carterae.AAC.5